MPKVLISFWFVLIPKHATRISSFECHLGGYSEIKAGNAAELVACSWARGVYTVPWVECLWNQCVENLAIRSSNHTFARTAHSFACSPALIRSLTCSLHSSIVVHDYELNALISNVFNIQPNSMCIINSTKSSFFWAWKRVSEQCERASKRMNTAGRMSKRRNGAQEWASRRAGDLGEPRICLLCLYLRSVPLDSWGWVDRQESRYRVRSKNAPWMITDWLWITESCS